MGRQQIEAPWTFHMAFAYDISSLLCNTVGVQVNLLCATYCTNENHSKTVIYNYFL